MSGAYFIVIIVIITMFLNSDDGRNLLQRAKITERVQVTVCINVVHWATSVVWGHLTAIVRTELFRP